MKKIIDRLRRLAQLRFAIFYPLGIYLAFFCNMDVQMLLPGCVVILIGVSVRLWANCYAIKMGRLTISGPYAYVRNPLYLGTVIIMFGVVVLLRAYIMGIVFFTVMAAVYYRTIMGEQRMLTDKFGENFLDYMRHVPAMIPRFSPYSKGEKWSFSWQRLWESREYKIAIWMTVAVIVFYLKEKILIEKEAWNIRHILLILSIAALGFVDLMVEAVRSRQKRQQVYPDLPRD